jgi:tetratricopeptide (TPR) repeat protein
MPRPQSPKPLATYPRTLLLAWAMATCVLAMPAHADDVADIRAMATAGDLPGALRGAERALAARPRDARLRFLQGVLLMESGRDEASLAVFTQMAQDYPELPDSYNNIALLHARAGRLEAALAAVHDALRADPGHRTARANLGQLHLMLAVQAWEALAQGGPVDAATQRRLETARALLIGTPTLGAR